MTLKEKYSSKTCSCLTSIISKIYKIDDIKSGLLSRKVYDYYGIKKITVQGIRDMMDRDSEEVEKLISIFILQNS